jgi:FixJ family two-component response regulator
MHRVVRLVDEFEGRHRSFCRSTGNNVISEQVVAIVDDDLITRVMLEHIIQAEGLATKCFSAPANFLQYMKRHRPICVLLDVNMPGMNGLQVLSRLTQMVSAVPVIVISAESAMTTARTALNYGVSSFISKPIDPERVIRQLRKVIGPQAQGPVSAS